MIEGLKEHLLGNYARCVCGPDNYLSFDDPNYLILKDGRLYGLYIPMRREIENVNHLIRRIYMSRLLYSAQMMPVLMDTGGLPQLSYGHLDRAFSTMMQPEDNIRPLDLLFPMLQETLSCHKL